MINDITQALSFELLLMNIDGEKNDLMCKVSMDPLQIKT